MRCNTGIVYVGDFKERARAEILGEFFDLSPDRRRQLQEYLVRALDDAEKLLAEQSNAPSPLTWFKFWGYRGITDFVGSSSPWLVPSPPSIRASNFKEDLDAHEASFDLWARRGFRKKHRALIKDSFSSMGRPNRRALAFLDSVLREENFLGTIQRYIQGESRTLSWTRPEVRSSWTELSILSIVGNGTESWRANLRLGGPENWWVHVNLKGWKLLEFQPSTRDYWGPSSIDL